MKTLSILIVIMGVMGLLAYKNPSMEDYNQFLRQSIIEETHKAKGDPLGQALGALFGGLAGTLVTNQTIRRDYVFFSLYEAKFGNDKLKLLGILKNFLFIEKPDLKNHRKN